MVWTRAGFLPHWSETLKLESAGGYTETEDFPQAHPLFWATTHDSCDLTPRFHAGLC